SGARVALWFDDPAYPIDAGYRAVLGRAADVIADAGARVEATHPPVDMVEQVGLFGAMIGAAISPSLPEDVAGVLAGSHLDWLRLEQQRAAVRARWAAWFSSWDVLLCPVTPTPALHHDQQGDFTSRTIDINGETRPYLDNIAWTGLIGIVGLPSAVPPLGRTASGLPVGVQVVAPYLHDRTAVRVAGLIAEVVDGAGYHVPPGF
ncbi:MAG: amidase family protein, partial [Acidimicrobiales bacterium]